MVLHQVPVFSSEQGQDTRLQDNDITTGVHIGTNLLDHLCSASAGGCEHSLGESAASGWQQGTDNKILPASGQHFQRGQTARRVVVLGVYIREYQTLLPPGIKLTVWTDGSRKLLERLSILNTTALSGLMLVLIVLALFLRFRLALWVAAGIPIALLGTIAVFPYADISISTVTVMAFILVLGILVDDAIVVGERVYGHEQMGKDPVQAAIDGTWEVSIPVIFGVLTTMAAFLPLIIVQGRMADFFGVLGWVVIISLAFSIIESQWILPAHLAHRNHQEATRGFSRAWNKLQSRLSDWLEGIARNYYAPLLKRAVEWRYATASVGLAVLIVALALIASGRVVFGFFPSVEGDRVFAQLEMPEGVSVDVTAAAAEQIERAGLALQQQLDEEFQPAQGSVVNNTLASIGAIVERSGPPRPQPGRSHYAEVVMELVPLEHRNNLSAKEVARRWRELTGSIPDAVKLTFNADEFSAGEPINYQLMGKDVDQMRTAAAELRAELARYDGVFDVNDSFRAGKQEIKLELLPEARTLGLTLSDLAGQVRNAFYGAEAQRIQRGQDDVRVMVRFPEDERKSIGNLEDMYIRTPDGNEVPFYSVARFESGRGFSTIRRVDGRRVVNVIADVDRSRVSPEEVNASIQREVLPGLKQRYRGLEIGLSGEQPQYSLTGTLGLLSGCRLQHQDVLLRGGCLSALCSNIRQRQHRDTSSIQGCQGGWGSSHGCQVRHRDGQIGLQTQPQPGQRDCYPAIGKIRTPNS